GRSMRVGPGAAEQFQPERGLHQRERAPEQRRVTPGGGGPYAFERAVNQLQQVVEPRGSRQLRLNERLREVFQALVADRDDGDAARAGLPLDAELALLLDDD